MAKKLCVIISIAIIVFFLASCSSKTTLKSTPDTPPEYTSDVDFKICNWCGVQSLVYELDETGSVIKSTERYLSNDEYLEQYQYLKDCGFTITQPSLIETGMGNALKQLEAADKVGIKQYVLDYTLTSKLSMYYDDYINEDITYEEVVEAIKKYIAPYLEHESLYGFFIKDEPDNTYFDQFGFTQKVIKEASGKEIYVNLFPVYATPGQFGGISYRNYIKQYVEKVDTSYISYDNYPIKGDGITTSVQSDFLYNMDYIRELAPEREIWTFLQCIKFGANNRAITSKADLAFQAYSFLAYGGDMIQWFTYWYPGVTRENFGMPLIDSLGNRTEVYFMCKELNNEILSLDDYYNNFEWKGIMINDVNGGSGNFGYVEESCITSATLKEYESDDDLLIGVFKDKTSERDGFMVVNFTDPGMNIKNNVTLNISGYKNALIIRDGVANAIRINDGKIQMELNSGEGAFVIPY